VTRPAEQPTDRPRPEDVFEVVRDALAIVLERDVSTIDWETGFEELQADSLALVEVAEIVEERLAPVAAAGFRLPDDELERLHSVGDAVSLVMARL